MRLPFFPDFCRHVKGEVQRLNGCNFHIDHYLKVLRERAVRDPSYLPFGGNNYQWQEPQYEAPPSPSEIGEECDLEAASLVERIRAYQQMPSDKEMAEMERIAEALYGRVA